MSTRKPRTQTLIISLVCLVIVAGAALYSSRNLAETRAVAIQNPADTISATVPLPSNDDWKNDFLTASKTSSSLAKKSSTKTAPAEPDTVTEQFGKQFFTQYVQLKQSGLLENKDVVDSVTNNLLAEEYLATDAPSAYTVLNLIITNDSSSASYKEYGNRVGTILSAHTPEKSDAYIAYTGIQKGNSAYLTELDSNIFKYRTMVNLLLKTPVPQNLSQAHLDLINGISGLQSLASALKSSSNDPMRSMMGLSRFGDTTTMLYNSMNTIKSTMLAAGISFAAFEGGSYFKLNSN